MTTFWLSTHLGYACRHSGACCRSGWPIPVERARVEGIDRAVAAGAARPTALPWLVPRASAPREVAGVLGVDSASGACVFHRSTVDGPSGAPGGCSIHPWRPVSCEHFPFLVVRDARGVHVTLSHYCPTAASLLFEDRGPVTVVAGPPVFADGREPEGLDAREALPPVRPGAAPVLMDWDEVTSRERDLLQRVSAAAACPEPPDLARFERVCATVPATPGWTPRHPDTHEAWYTHVAPSWEAWAAVIGRYLAAKVHASWALYVGRGLEDVEAGVDTARVVLQVEAARLCAAAARPLDGPILLNAIRRSDLLLVHLSDPLGISGPVPV